LFDFSALPEEMRQEIIEQERQQQQRMRQESEAAADPSNAEDMDNANFLASLAPDLRQEILLTADEDFLRSLPPEILAEANILRERVAAQHRSRAETHARQNITNATNHAGARAGDTQQAARRRQRNGKIRVETDRQDVIYTPKALDGLGPLLTGGAIKSLFRLFYLLSPVQRQRIFQKLFLNLCRHSQTRHIFINMFPALLHNDKTFVMKLIPTDNHNTDSFCDDDFPPSRLIGIPPESGEDNAPVGSFGMSRRNEALSAFTAAACMPASSRGSNTSIPPTVARRIVMVLSSLAKSSPRICVGMIQNDTDSPTCLDRLLDLFKASLYTKSAKNLEQLLCLIEIVVGPLALLPKADVEVDLSSERATQGIEFVKVPRVVVSRERLHLLVNALRLEICNDTSFTKVNIISRRLSRVDDNRDFILGKKF
jgi:hypothetical protein